MKFVTPWLMIISCICVMIIMALTPVWSDTGVVLENTSQFVGQSWQRTIVIHTMSHGNFTFKSTIPVFCSNANGIFHVNETVGVWANVFGCVNAVERT